MKMDGIHIKKKDSEASQEQQELENKTKVYYSTQQNPSDNVSYGGWLLAENVTDWNKIKSYMIVLDSSYEFLPQTTIEFEYEISIPSDVDYNKVSYSKHKVYYTLDYQNKQIDSSKLGLMIAKKYDLVIEKYQGGTNKALKGITFLIEEEEQHTSKIKVTDENGKLIFSDLSINKYYKLKEQKTTDEYVLNSQEIRFCIKNEKGTENLSIEYVDENKNPIDPFSFIRSSKVDDTTDPVVTFQIDNKEKAKVEITTVDAKDNSTPINNTKYILFNKEDIQRLEEQGINPNDINIGDSKIGKIYTADKNGQINISGIYLDEEYVLKEIKAVGYYIPELVKFKITKNDGTYLLEHTENGLILDKIITVTNEIPTLSLKFKNHKIPTYSLQLTKYAKNEKITGEDGIEKDKVLKGAQYRIYGEGKTNDGRLYVTNEDGIITIEGLYEYVDGQYITGEYTLEEIFAPEGYAINTTEITFKAYRENGELKVVVLQGSDIIKNYETINQDIINPKEDFSIVNIEVEDDATFSLHKRDTDTGKPIEGAKFKITNLEGETAYDKNGNILDNLVSDKNGNIILNLREGFYKAKEIEAPEGYILPEEEIEFRSFRFSICS